MIMAILAVIDHRQNRLPDVLTLPTLWLGLIINIESVFAPLSHAVIGAVCGYTVIRIIHDAEVLIRSRSGIGLGDAKLLAALGAWYGPTRAAISGGRGNTTDAASISQTL